MNDILCLLPHRYPFLLVDKILTIEPGKRVVGLKCVSGNEPYFDGHFPGRSVMPGVMILEAIAQVADVLLPTRENGAEELPYLTCIKRARFRCPVVPGGVLILSMTLTRLRGNAGWAKGEARIERKLVCDMAFSFSIACAR